MECRSVRETNILNYNYLSVCLHNLTNSQLSKQTILTCLALQSTHINFSSPFDQGLLEPYLLRFYRQYILVLGWMKENAGHDLSQFEEKLVMFGFTINSHRFLLSIWSRGCWSLIFFCVFYWQYILAFGHAHWFEWEKTRGDGLSQFMMSSALDNIYIKTTN